MADVRLSIAGRDYIVTCKDGEEERLTALGRLVDTKAREASAAGGLNESRQLLFAGLLLADEIFDLQLDNRSTASSADLADALEKLAARVETLAADLEQAG